MLQHIALCYFFASIVFLYFRLRGMAIICAVLLVGYWALMTFVPFPDISEPAVVNRMAAEGSLDAAAVAAAKGRVRGVTGKASICRTISIFVTCRA